MDSKQRQLVNKYLDLLLRRKILILTLLLVSLPAGLGGYLMTPKVYQATSLLSYQQQKISPNKMSPEVVSKIRDTVGTLTQVVTSRTNLEKLITEQNLYPEARQKLPMEDVVDLMRKEIQIAPSGQGDIFKITFNNSSADKAVKVTNALAARFIEENLKYREERATETSSYTSTELEMAKATMDRKENAMRDYKLNHFNEMPEQREGNVSRLIALQEQYQGKQDSIQDLERTLIMIQDQITNRKKVLAYVPRESGETDIKGTGPAQEPPMSNEVRLAKAKLVLEQLLSRYTELHPEVKKTRGIIAKLEESGTTTQHPGTELKIEGKRSIPIDPTTADKEILQLEAQRKNVLLNIESIKSEKEQLKKSIAEYEAWVTAAPTREAEWSSLTREYDQLKRHYDYLVAQDLEAKSMLNLEKRQKGSQFKIEDNARYPEKPIKPNFAKIMGMAIALGLGAGVGLSLMLAVFDTTIRDPETVEPLLGVPLITTIPYLETKSEQKKKKWLRLFSAAFLLAGVLLVAVFFAVVWVRGYIVI